MVGEGERAGDDSMKISLGQRVDALDLINSVLTSCKPGQVRLENDLLEIKNSGSFTHEQEIQLVAQLIFWREGGHACSVVTVSRCA